MGIDEREQYAKQIRAALEEAAAEYEQLAAALRRLNGMVDRIGQTHASGSITANTIAVEAARAIGRNTPSLATLLARTGEYDSEVPKLPNS
ncbi:hypothetical protein ACFXGA_25850 [Actinosynnema sp. NPDC059335]|uniref:hypothetical protein n=1 Tax=Actinosynnema sp. NPDC059335 TaxID=3346804 RepID=UPI00366DA3A5